MVYVACPGLSWRMCELLHLVPVQRADTQLALDGLLAPAEAILAGCTVLVGSLPSCCVHAQGVVYCSLAAVVKLVGDSKCVLDGLPWGSQHPHIICVLTVRLSTALLVCRVVRMQR